MSNVKDKYSLSKTIIGQGTSGVVVKATLRSDPSQEFACKLVPKKRIKNVVVFKENLDLLLDLKQTNIVRHYEYFEDDKCIFIIMEFIQGKELFSLLEFTKMQLTDVRKVFRAVLDSVVCIHNNNMVHRDLKLENFMIENDDFTKIKMIDFGLAKTFSTNPDEYLKTKAGTPYYIAPEVLSGKYDFKCDIWSLGVLLYILISQQPPFYGNTEEEVLRRVLSCEYSMKGEKWDTVPESCKTIIRDCLKLDTSKRPTANKLLEYKWLTE